MAIDIKLHLLVRRVEDATLLSQRMMVLAGKKWNSRTVHKEVRWGNNLTVGIRNGSVQIRDKRISERKVRPVPRDSVDNKCNESLFIGGHS